MSTAGNKKMTADEICCHIHHISFAVIFLLPAVDMTDDVNKQPMCMDNPANVWDGLAI